MLTLKLRILVYSPVNLWSKSHKSTGKNALRNFTVWTSKSFNKSYFIVVVIYYLASNSQAERSILIGWFSVGIYSTDHYHGNGAFPYFFLSSGKFKLSETQKVFKKSYLIQ